MAYGDFKYLAKRIASDKVLILHKAFNIAKNTKYDGYQRGIASMAMVLTRKLNKRNN